VDLGLEAAPNDLPGNLPPTESRELKLLPPLPKRRLHPVGNLFGGNFNAEYPLGWTEFFNRDFHVFSRGVSE
jgi:hypothetical protein